MENQPTELTDVPRSMTSPRVENADVEGLRRLIADYQANLAVKDAQIVSLEEEKAAVSAEFAH